MGKEEQVKTAEKGPVKPEEEADKYKGNKSFGDVAAFAARKLDEMQKLDVAGKVNQIINFINDKLGVDWSKVDKATADQLATFAGQGFTEVSGFDKDQRWVDLKDKNGSTRTLSIRFPQPKGMEKGAKNMEMYSALVQVVQHMLGGIDWGTVTDDTQERLMVAVEKGLVDIDYEKGFKPTATGYEISLTDRRGKVEKFAVNFTQKPKEEDAFLAEARDEIRERKSKAVQERAEIALADLEKRIKPENPPEPEYTPTRQAGMQLVAKWNGKADQVTADDKRALLDLAPTLVDEYNARLRAKGGKRELDIMGVLREFAAGIGVPGDYEHQDQINAFVQSVLRASFDHKIVGMGPQIPESGGNALDGMAHDVEQEITKDTTDQG